jgi:hypothetical protein
MNGGVGEPVAQIVLRPLGSPLTLGMSGLAIASLVQTGVELHWTPASQTLEAGLILIAVPFVLQLLACALGRSWMRSTPPVRSPSSEPDTSLASRASTSNLPAPWRFSALRSRQGSADRWPDHQRACRVTPLPG